MDSQDGFGEFDDFQDFNDSTDFEESAHFAAEQIPEKPSLGAQIIDLMVPFLNSDDNSDIATSVLACTNLLFENHINSPVAQSNHLSTAETPNFLRDFKEISNEEFRNILRDIQEDNISSIEPLKIDIYDILAGNLGIPTFYTHALNYGYDSLSSTKKSPSYQKNLDSGSIDLSKEPTSPPIGFNTVNHLSHSSELYSDDPESHKTQTILSGTNAEYGKFEDFTVEQIEALLEEAIFNPEEVSEASLLNSLEIMEIHIKNAKDRQKSLKESTAAYNQVIQVLIEQAEKLKIESKVNGVNSSNSAQVKKSRRFSFLTRKQESPVSSPRLPKT